MRPLTARFVVFVCAVLAFAALPPIAEGYLWIGYGLLASAILGARSATAYLLQDRLLFGVLFATLAFVAVSASEPLSGGLTVRHFAAFVVAALVLGAFASLSVRTTGASTRADLAGR
jgi:hypothetical protein